MLVVETIAKIRRAFFVQKKPIKEICRARAAVPGCLSTGSLLHANLGSHLRAY